MKEFYIDCDGIKLHAKLDQVNEGKEGMPEGPEKKVYRECQFCHCSFPYHSSYDKQAFDEHELVCGGSQPL